ncbi:PH domain-containing protein [Arthrobacter sp. Sa2BUA2]|uniref:PH domain-containing protein n=1 Tax=Arthrobacter pullicola TaxID=2762224 RepID=A0ABR8YDQ1_9MICC|nr:PH domain-containing protein [Arthrobacter pullicola]MBD8042317.1 PH domain-containing protein [Arthrobacter pullicola]
MTAASGDRENQELPENPEPVPAAEPDWKRVHPVSPLVRGWIALAAIAYFVGRDRVEAMFRNEGGGPLPDGTPVLWAVLGLLAVLLVVAGIFFLSWWFTRYQVTADHVRVRSGILFRQHRQARLDRVQAIDIVQPLLARLFGLAELRFEVADAGESAVRLAFLRLDDARSLRATILDRASGAEPEAGTGNHGAGRAPASEAPEYPILALAPGRVLGAALLSGNTVFLLLGTAFVVVLAAVTREGISLAVIIPVLLGVAGGYWSAINSAWNFRAAVSRDGIRVRYGLLDTRTQTVPPGRIQAVAVSQPLLWRLTGWYRVSVNVAGYGTGATSEGAARTRLLPAGTLEETMQILAIVLPNPGSDDPYGLFAAGMAGSGEAHGFTNSPRRARWVAPLQWRRSGFAVTQTALLSRSGRLWRSLAVVPHERIQSMALEQGPLARKLRIADLRLHSTPGPVAPRIRQIDAAAALQLFDEQSLRARDARRRDRTERWLHRETATGPAPAAEASAGLPERAASAEAAPAEAAPEERAPGTALPSEAPPGGPPHAGPAATPTEENWNEHR